MPPQPDVKGRRVGAEQAAPGEGTTTLSSPCSSDKSLPQVEKAPLSSPLKIPPKCKKQHAQPFVSFSTSPVCSGCVRVPEKFLH